MQTNFDLELFTNHHDQNSQTTTLPKRNPSAKPLMFCTMEQEALPDSEDDPLEYDDDQALVDHLLNAVKLSTTATTPDDDDYKTIPNHSGIDDDDLLAQDPAGATRTLDNKRGAEEEGENPPPSQVRRVEEKDVALLDGEDGYSADSSDDGHGDMAVITARQLRDPNWQFDAGSTSSAGGSVPGDFGRLQKQRHQIGWLAATALHDEEKILEASAKMRDAKRNTRAKYGW